MCNLTCGWEETLCTVGNAKCKKYSLYYWRIVLQNISCIHSNPVTTITQNRSPIFDDFIEKVQKQRSSFTPGKTTTIIQQ